MQAAERQFVYDAAAGAVVRLAKDKYGCGTLHRCLEAGDDNQKLQLAMAVGRNARPMATDAHGNYILQNVMAMDRLQPKEAAVESLSGSFVALAKHKFGSNVVEKCVSAGEWALQAVMGEIFLVKNGVEELLGDRYGNFVMQAIIKKCKVDGELLHSLRSRITDYERVHAGWSESLVGVRILQKLNKRLRSARALELREAAANEQEQQVAQLLDDGESEPEPETEGKSKWRSEPGWQQPGTFTPQGDQWRGSEGGGRNNAHTHGRSAINGREHGAGPGRRQRTPAQQQKQKERQQQRMLELQTQRAKRQQEQFHHPHPQQLHQHYSGHQQVPNQMPMAMTIPTQGQGPPFNQYSQNAGANPNNMQLLDPQQQAQMLHQHHILEQQMAMQQQQMQLQQAQMAAQQAQMAQMQAQMQASPTAQHGDVPQLLGPGQSPPLSPPAQNQIQAPVSPQPMSPAPISQQTAPGQVIEHPVAQRARSPQSPHHDLGSQPKSPTPADAAAAVATGAATGPVATRQPPVAPEASPAAPAVTPAATTAAPSATEMPGSPTASATRGTPEPTSAAVTAAVPDVVPTEGPAAATKAQEVAPEPSRKTSRMPFGNQNEPSLAAEVDTLTAALDSGVLRAFLASQGLEKFESVLADHEVRNLETLCMLQEEDLSELGMLKGPRVKMLRSMRAWQAEQNSGGV
jgi:hypothetical protein